MINAQHTSIFGTLSSMYCIAHLDMAVRQSALEQFGATRRTYLGVSAYLGIKYRIGN